MLQAYYHDAGESSSFDAQPLPAATLDKTLSKATPCPDLRAVWPPGGTFHDFHDSKNFCVHSFNPVDAK
jgi:hypothetical protein